MNTTLDTQSPHKLIKRLCIKMLGRVPNRVTSKKQLDVIYPYNFRNNIEWLST